MNEQLIARLREQLDGPHDGALVRHSLALALQRGGEHAAAAMHARRAVTFDPLYAAAWKLLGKSLLETGDRAGAAEAWQHGIEAARTRSERQAEKEMGVFLRRLQKSE